MSGQHQQPEVEDQDRPGHLQPAVCAVSLEQLHGLLAREDDSRAGTEGGGQSGLAGETVQQGAVQALR